MVTTRSRSQGSPQVRDLEAVSNSRKRLHSEQASPLHVKKRSQRLNPRETEIQPSQTGSTLGETKNQATESISRSPELHKQGTDVLNSVHLALRQRSSATESSALNEASSTLLVEPRSSKHVRFGGEGGPTVDALSSLTEPSARPRAMDGTKILQSNSQNGEPEDDNHSDEAPEAISISNSQAQARNFAGEATKAIRSQQKTEKDLRKQKDFKLKWQAQEASLRRTRGKDNDAAGHDDVSQLARQLLKEDRMPEYLPSAILEAQPELMAQSKQQQQQRKEKLATAFVGGKLRNKVKSPKEMIRQGRVVKILESNDSLQPSSIMTSSKHVRESWLAGRRKNDDSVANRRRPFSKGFLRR